MNPSNGKKNHIWDGCEKEEGKKVDESRHKRIWNALVLLLPLRPSFSPSFDMVRLSSCLTICSISISTVCVCVFGECLLCLFCPLLFFFQPIFLFFARRLWFEVLFMQLSSFFFCWAVPLSSDIDLMKFHGNRVIAFTWCHSSKQSWVMLTHTHTHLHDIATDMCNRWHCRKPLQRSKTITTKNQLNSTNCESQWIYEGKHSVHTHTHIRKTNRQSIQFTLNE